jgi:hypothetical protein
VAYRLNRIEAGDPFVVSALRTYLLKWNIRDEVGFEPTKEWWALYEEGINLPVLTFGYLRRADGGLELTDVYIAPSRAGLKAIKYAGETLKAALAGGVVPYVMASTFRKNKRALKWAKDFLGKQEADIMGMVFPGATLDPERAKILA